MPRVCWASIATTSPMGQQRYEHEIQAAMRRVASSEWSFHDVRVTSARSSIADARRLPARLNAAAPLAISRLIGRAIYGAPDLVHRFDLRLPAAWGREVVTVHDLPPLRFGDEGRLSAAALPSARRAAQVVVPSRFAASEVAVLAGVGGAEVIPYGISREYRDASPATDDDLASLGVAPPFVMHAAGASERKNLGGLADAFRDVRRRHPSVTLLLCGPPDARRDALFETVPGVVKPGRLEPSFVAGLMRRAAAVIVPSTYEGFGLPALEGMAAGCPVVAVRRGALPEVCGEAALLVEADARSIAEGIERVLDDPTLSARLRARGPARADEFDWDEAARAHLRLYRQVIG